MTIVPRFPVEISNLTLFHQGKSRDTFATKSPNHLAIWASNRISTHDIVHESIVEGKGEVLTSFTKFWLSLFEKESIKHHLVASGSRVFEYLPGSPRDYPKDFHLRTIIVKKKNPAPYEFIFRNRLDGSLYTDYYGKGIPNPYEVHLEGGMKRMGAFASPLFTPTTKSDDGDLPLSAEEVSIQYPQSVAVGQRIMAIATEYVRSRGVELIDTKFEFDNDTLIDEVLTPDSSRYTMLSGIELGHAPVSLDKQIARDEAVRMWKDGPRRPLTFVPETLVQLTKTYNTCFKIIAGMPLATFQGMYLE